MGDLSAEPSMEEILSSIKRIIAEEGDGPAPRGRRQPRAAPVPLAQPPLVGDEMPDSAGEVLELSDPMPPMRPDPIHAESPRGDPNRVEPARSDIEARARDEPSTSTGEPILSAQTAAASRGALDQLSRLMIKPEPGSDGSLEGLVRELLRPMLREWLDAQLPAIVEAMVQREIKRITGGQG